MKLTVMNSLSSASTMQILLYIIQVAILCLNTTSALFFQPQQTDTLVLVHVLHRHGDRAPSTGETYPNDPYANHTYAPYGRDQLTLKGKKKAYNIGLELKNRYNDYLGDEYVTDIVKAQSTNYKRTKMTLQLVLAALFPPSDDDKMADDLDWQPIPYLYDAHSYLLADDHCLNYQTAYYRYLLTNTSDQLLAEHKDLLNSLTKYSGKYMRGFDDIFNLWSTFKSQEDFGLQLPDWAWKYYPDQLDAFALAYYQSATSTQSLRRLGAGALLSKIINDTQTKIAGNLNGNTKIFIYSAHDTTIGRLLATLQVMANHQVPFAAYVIFEVRKVNNDYGFKLYYQNYTADDPHLLKLPNCNEFCHINDFIKLVQNDLPTVNDTCDNLDEI